MDADSFFASCEVARRPELKGKPVLITGRIGSFVLAKTHEAKKMGVKTVMPIWEAKQKCPNGIYLPGDFKYYTLMSRRLMKLLKTWSPELQVSSIDEAYADLSGIDKMHNKSFSDIGKMICQQIKDSLGITVSVGIAPNKVLAKMACETRKPNGSRVLRKKDIDFFLENIDAKAIPGIGHRRQQKLDRYGIKTGMDLKRLSSHLVKSLFGIGGLMLWKELHGDYMFRIESGPRIPKQIGRTSSLDECTKNKTLIEGLAFYHLERSLEALHRNELATKEISLYLRSKDFKRYYLPHHFTEKTDDYLKISQALKKLIQKIPKGESWRSAGIFFNQLESAKIKQLNLFEKVETVIKNEKLNKAKNALNKRYGQFTLRSASSLHYKIKKESDDSKLGIIN